MGNTQSLKLTTNGPQLTQAEFIKQLNYIESTAMPNIGTVQIYRFKDPPYQHIMKHRRAFQYNDPTFEIYKRNLSLLSKQLLHKNIVQIHYYKNNTLFHMCGKNSQIQIYCSYYTITLEEIIRKRRKDDIRFTANQILYVLKALLEVSVLLRKNNYNFGSYRSKNITLSSEGYIKIYIIGNCHKDYSGQSEDQIYNEYSLAFNNRIKIYQNLPLPPQFLPSLKQGNMQFCFHPEKQDSFMIAAVILQMLIDEDIRKYYGISQENFCTYRMSSVWKDLGMLGLVYDKKYLLGLLQRMLCQDPSKRCSTSQALQFINQNRQNISIGASLRMFEDDQNNIKPKISYRTSFDFESNPNILQFKLTACPIKTLTKKSNNNKSIGVSLTSSKKSIQTKDKSLNKSRILQNNQSRGSSLSTKVGNRN